MVDGGGRCCRGAGEPRPDEEGWRWVEAGRRLVWTGGVG